MEPSDLADDPLVQIQRWLDDAVAAGLHEPNAMSFATAATAGDSARPSVRTVLLKDISDGGLVFFTNYKSQKAKELHSGGAVSLTWPTLGRQIRAAGTVMRTSAEESDAYFATRPRGSQLAAWASPQSKTIPDRAFLEERFAEFDLKFKDQPVPRPPDWGGYRLIPNEVEFWSRGQDRLHDRIRFRRRPFRGGWRVDRLAP